MTNNKLFLLLGLTAIVTLGGYMMHNSKREKTLKEIPYKYSSVDDQNLRISLFKAWTVEHNKQYSKVESHLRFQAWNQNYDIVQEHNAKNLTWELGMNQFADLPLEEFAALHLGYIGDPHPENDPNSEILDEVDAPTSIDWRDKGAVTAVRNQGNCGGCYAFATGGALESLYKIKKGKLNVLSPQQIIDCSGSYGNQGCNGGLLTTSFSYTQKNGIELESSYPYRQAQGSCRHSTSKSVFSNTGYTNVAVNNPNQLKAATAIGPVSIAVQAAQNTFQLYRGGIITSNCNANLDHAIINVGYGTSGSTDYWIVKNSWGASWGEKGYVRIARGSQNGGRGLCGINSSATYPKL